MEIKTWVERCNDHPDHQTGMISHSMIQTRMQEEIEDLRAEVERLRAALNSIARNTCCGGCQEAARVAREAMEAKP